MKRNNMIKITSLVMPFVLLISASGCKLNKESKYDDLEVITTQSDTYLNSNFDDLEEKEEIEKEELELKETKVENDYDLNSLYSLLDKNSTQFSNEIKEYLKKVIERSYYNSKDLNNVLKTCGFKGNGDFIKRKIIDALPNIKNIRILDSSIDEDYYELYEKESSTRWNNEDKTIYLFCDEIENFDRTFLEEIVHAGQENDNTYDYSESVIKDEGDANFVAEVCTSGRVNNNYVCSFYDDETMNKASINYGTGYLSYTFGSKYYMYLLSLTDCDTIEKFIDENNSKIITNKISSLYGIDGEKFYEDMKSVTIDAALNIFDKRNDIVKSIEKTYLDCLEKKIDLIDSKEDAISMIDLYRYINLQFGYEYISYDENSDNYTYITNKVIDRDKIINKLYEKAIKYDAFNLSKNKEINKKAFNALINPKKDEENIVHFISITDKNITLNGTKLKVSNGKTTYETDINSLQNSIINEENKIDVPDIKNKGRLK